MIFKELKFMYNRYVLYNFKRKIFTEIFIIFIGIMRKSLYIM